MIERYREWYEHERDCNDRMLAMVESVPGANRSAARLARAVQLAHHLAVCGENWLDRMAHGGNAQKDWWPEGHAAEALRARYAKVEKEWTAYLARTTEADLAKEFEFLGSDGRTQFRWSIEGQIVQLVGHAFYHRGQIALLVEELGGQTENTDYLFWAYKRNARYGPISAPSAH